MLDIDWEVSARHIHLSEQDSYALFGRESLTHYKDLSQPGQYACAETVTVVGDTLLKNVRVLGPFRSSSQLEISISEARNILRIPAPPVRLSGDLKNAPTVVVRSELGDGNSNRITVPVIVAARHVHLSERDSITLQLFDGDVIGVEIDGERGKTILGGCVVRVGNFSKVVHIDTDEYNSILPKKGSKARLVYSNGFYISCNQE